MMGIIWNAFSSPDSLAASFEPDNPSKGVFAVDDMDIELVVSQVKCSREQAMHSLRKHRNDIVSSVLELNEEEAGSVGGGGKKTDMEVDIDHVTETRELVRILDIDETRKTFEVYVVYHQARPL